MIEYIAKNLSLSSPGKRLQFFRSLICPNRIKFCEQHGISPNTLKAWEGDTRPIKEKGALKLIEVFAREEILCTVEWLLYGKGAPPVTLQDFTSSLNISETSSFPSMSDLGIQSEIAIFSSNNPHSRIFKVQDDSMEPALYEGDIIGGILENLSRPKSFIKKPGILVEENENYHVRVIIPSQTKGAYNLIPLNSQMKCSSPIPFNIIPKNIYKIIWIRRSSNL